MIPYAAQLVNGYDIVPVVPSDNPLPGGACRALWIGSSGNISVTTIQGNRRNDVPVFAGVFPIQCSHVHVTSTSAADNIWAIY